MIGISIGMRAVAGGTAPAPVPPTAFTMTQLGAANRIHQRDTTSGGGQGKGQGAVPVTLNVTRGGPLYARCRSAGDGTTIVQAAWLAMTVSAGSGVRTIAGVDARLGWFFLDLSGDGATWSLGTTPIGMGALVAMGGQSLMTRLFHRYDFEDTTTIAAAGASVTPNGRVFGAIDTAYDSGNPATIPNTWQQLADGGAINGAGAAELLTRLVAVAGVTVGLVAKTEGATAIADWQPGQPLGDALTATMDAAGGKFEALIWYQGHSDSNAGATAAYYQAKLTSLFANLAAHNSFAAPAIIVASIPNISSASWGSVAAKETIRRASHDWAVANGAIPVLMNDIQLGGDGVHALQAGSLRQGRHFYRALRPHFGAARGDTGAVLGAPTHAAGSASVVIPFTLPSGATTLSGVGSPASRFKVYKRGTRVNPLAFDGATPFAIDNAARTITLKLAADPGQVPLDVLPFGANDPVADGSASMMFDDLLDADGIAQGRQLFPGVEPVRVVVPSNLVLTAPAYGVGKYGQTLTSGSGATPAPFMPAAAEGWRVEAWLRVDTPENAIRVFLGQNFAMWIACQNNDLKCQVGAYNGTIQTFAGVLTTGAWHHVALTCEAPGTSYVVHVDGVQQGGPIAAPDDYDGSAYPLGIRFLGGYGDFYLTTQSIDEVAIWRGKWPTAVVPGTAYSGSEAGLIGLWHMDGSGANSAGG